MRWSNADPFRNQPPLNWKCLAISPKEKFLLVMSLPARGVIRFFSSGIARRGPSVTPSVPPAVAPVPPPSPPPPPPPPKPTTLVGKIKSYIPGRNWLIFGGFVLSWVSLAAYDKRERKKVTEKWCKKVEHLSRRTIAFHEDVPSVGVWIGAPPGDQLKWNKEVWREYVKVSPFLLLAENSQLLLLRGLIIRCI